MKTILFVIHLDKFTKGFYNFIYKNFSKQECYFLFYGKHHQFDFEVDDNKCYFRDSYKNITKSDELIQIAKKCNAIIYSGLFGTHQCIFRFGCKSLKKTYIHLWGNDFYSLGEKNTSSFKQRISALIKCLFINNAKGIITLIQGDYDELCKLCKPKGQHFVAPMCGDGSGFEIIKSLRSVKKSISPIKILVGNSATESNQHIQVFRMLEKFKNEDIQVVCPLSYGVEQYRDYIIQNGQNIFGEKFVPLIEFMEKEQYYKLIAESHIAIFNNNRQQAMGNIIASIALGCKVYIRNDTPMWKQYYIDKKMYILNVEEIRNMEFSDFIYIAPNDNYDKYLKHSDMLRNIEAWQIVFDSIG